MKKPPKIDERIERDCLKLFEQSKGYQFRVKGTPLQDHVEGVDWKNMMVKGRKYGDFAVSLCEISGPPNLIPES